MYVRTRRLVIKEKIEFSAEGEGRRGTYIHIQ